MSKQSASPASPLFLHRNGQWAKKIHGKHRYFGCDRDLALTAWLAQKDSLLAGIEPTPVVTSPTVTELANLYMDRCHRRLKSNDLAASTAIEYETIVRRLIEFVGPNAEPAKWSPIDFARITEHLHQPIARKVGPRGGVKGRSVKRRSSTTVAISIRAIKAFLNWCEKSELIPPTVRA